MKKLLTGTLLCVLLSSMYSCKKDPPQDEARQKIQVAMDKARKQLSDTLGIDFPSINLIIQTPTEKIFVSSKSGTSQAVTADTYFRFASDTKNFTATSILNMWEDGWLDYRDKITDIIPGSKSVTYVPTGADWDFPHKNEITIRQLLQHSAGVFDVDNRVLSGYNGLTYTEAVHKANPMHQFTTSEMVKVLVDRDTSFFAPGQSYEYSNTGYSILAEIIKRVYSQKAGTPKTFADYIKDYITGPNTPVPLHTLSFPVLATDVNMPNPHVTSTLLETTGADVYDAYNITAQIGEGNGYGSMEDLNKYVRTLLKSENVLKPATVQLMQHDVSAANPDYGLGCDFEKNLGYGHNGGRIGYLNVMKYDPQHDVSVVVMIPLYDLRTATSFRTCLTALKDAAYSAREILGYPGKP